MSIEEKDPFKFRVNPLTANNYFAWSNDMEIVLRGKGLWKYVDDVDLENGQNEDEEEVQLSETEETKRDLALAYLVTSIDTSCKSMVRTMRCPRTVWRSLRNMFQSASQAAIDAKLTQLQSISLNNGENIVEYSSRLLGLNGELKDAS